MTAIEILTPVGRLVSGSLYEPQTTDMEGRALVIKTGINAGQPTQRYFFALAIEKRNETHWNQTEWGAKIWQAGQAGFPGGQANLPHFAWKVEDGDSTVPNRVGRKNCDREGYPGHWVLKFSSSFAPQICNHDGHQFITEKNFVELGYYIQVSGTVGANDSQQQPGVYLNHRIVAFAGYGKRIILAPDPKAVGFGQSPLPAGISATPLESGFNPKPTDTTPVTAPVAPQSMAAAILPPVPASTPPVPYPAILQPSVAPRVMLPKAQGTPYDQWIAAGWTDAQLIQHGMMQ